MIILWLCIISYYIVLYILFIDYVSLSSYCIIIHLSSFWYKKRKYDILIYYRHRWRFRWYTKFVISWRYESASNDDEGNPSERVVQALVVIDAWCVGVIIMVSLATALLRILILVNLLQILLLLLFRAVFCCCCCCCLETTQLLLLRRKLVLCPVVEPARTAINEKRLVYYIKFHFHSRIINKIKGSPKT